MRRWLTLLKFLVCLIIIWRLYCKYASMWDVHSHRFVLCFTESPTFHCWDKEKWIVFIKHALICSTFQLILMIQSTLKILKKVSLDTEGLTLLPSALTIDQDMWYFAANSEKKSLHTRMFYRCIRGRCNNKNQQQEEFPCTEQTIAKS